MHALSNTHNNMVYTAASNRYTIVGRQRKRCMCEWSQSNMNEQITPKIDDGRRQKKQNRMKRSIENKPRESERREIQR